MKGIIVNKGKHQNLWVFAFGLFMFANAYAGDNAASRAHNIHCDSTLVDVFKPDERTHVVAVKLFRKGDSLRLNDNGDPGEVFAENDLCMVKLNVGPGNPGPIDAPSTSIGIGIEVWLPAAREDWNQRIHALGGGGWQGGSAGSATEIASLAAAKIAATEGAVSSVTDTGHTVEDGSFAMNPDGSINQVLWEDFATRAIHEQAIKTKALTSAYYGRQAKYAYWDGGSTGGRQGMSLAQNYPADFNGIIANFPALNWSRFLTALLYPQIVFQRDLGGVPLTLEQLDLVSNATIASCDVVGGEHLGYISAVASCNYDPTTDIDVLCESDGGANGTAACVTVAQAQAVNKIWYGMTVDGSVPDPAVDNGWSAANEPVLPGGKMLWWGLSRGTSLYSKFYFDNLGFDGPASPNGPFTIAADQVALELQMPEMATPSFINATSRGKDYWRKLSYEALASAYSDGVELQDYFGGINTDNPNLSVFKSRGGRILTWHGLADELIMPQGTINYYNRVVEKMGGLANVQSFYRLYLVPGAGHATRNGTSNPDADVPNFGASQIYDSLVQWVENGIEPRSFVLHGEGGSSGLVCMYPERSVYIKGSPRVATNYTCR